ncbi:MAG: hypothetical protein Q7R41_11130 [Phycisphaerales bacterium]|nr:hypothetical protein [Phycisphaerales bacterium]
MNRQAIAAVACVTLLVTSSAFAQQPLASPPASPQFLSRYDFHLSAAALANDDRRFSWDTHFGGDIDIVDYVHGRAATVMDYEAVLGNEFRPFDPNQGNYILELSASYRIKRTEVAAIFHHVSRHLGDRQKVIPVAWNILGVRVLREATLKKATIDMVAEFGGTTQKVNVDYRWSSNVDVVVRRRVAPRVAVFARGSGHLMSVIPSPALTARHTQTGGVVEGGLRLIGEAGVGELFVGYEHRFDAYPLGFVPERWFMAGFRVLRR